MAIFTPTRPQFWPNRLNQIYTDIVTAYKRDQQGVSVARMMKWYGATSPTEFNQLLGILFELKMIELDQYGAYKPMDEERSFKDRALCHFSSANDGEDRALLTVHISLNMIFSTERTIEDLLIPARMNEILQLGNDSSQYNLAMRWLKFLDLGVSVPAPNLPTKQIIIPTYTKILLDALRRSDLLQDQQAVDLYALISNLRQTLAFVDGSNCFNRVRLELKEHFQVNNVIRDDLDKVGVKFDGVGSGENILSYGLAHSLLLLHKQRKIKLITTADFRGHDEIVKLPLSLVPHRNRIQPEVLTRPDEIHQIMLIDQTGGEP